ncbi:MAG: sugar transferase [Anaerolineae bacterium]
MSKASNLKAGQTGKRYKRWLDLLVVVPACILLTPLMGLVALVVWAAMGCPVLFRQRRPGLCGKPFTIFKFRTMSQACDEHGKPLPEARRLTRLGSFLRRSSLDELPELFNVLAGTMSLVGPRPLRVEYLPLYSAQQNRRHDVKPGITGWAQVNGRNALSWEKKFELDVWYVDHYNLLLDCKIIALTLVRLLDRQGIVPEGQVVMPRFTGSSETQREIN